MPRAYSLDLRERVVACVQKGNTQKCAAELFSISKSSVEHYARLARENRPLEGRKSTGRTPKLSKEQHLKLKEQVLEYSSATLQEHCDLWKKQHGIGMSISSMYRYIHQLGITLKKSN